jgi:hypothetical protein
MVSLTIAKQRYRKPSFSSSPTLTKLLLALYNSVTLTLSTLTTLTALILPIPFIPTPRLTLLTTLFILSVLVLASGTIAHVSTLRYPQQQTYLQWYTAESTLSIVFANLPFLSSLVVTKAPARIRSTLQWPRSRQGSLADLNALTTMRMVRVNSMASTVPELTSPIDAEQGDGWSGVKRDVDGTAKESGVSGTISPREEVVHGQVGPALPSPSLMRSGTRDGSSVPKTRLSGGLAEMGEVNLQDSGQGWPIYWR